MRIAISTMLLRAVAAIVITGLLFFPYFDLVQTWKRKTTNFPLLPKLVQDGFSEAPVPH